MAKHRSIYFKTNLGEALRGWRYLQNYGVRKAGQSIGVSSATISRIERGYEVDGKTMRRIIVWLFETKRSR